jgi:predicted amidohydrolase YtcJ
MDDLGIKYVLTGGSVYSKGMTTSAPLDVVVKDGRITDVLPGGRGTSRDLRENGYRPVDVSGKLVLPGFHDSHLHPTTAARALSQNCWLAQELDALGYLSTIRRYVAAQPGAGWIVGRGWRPALLREARFDRRTLDEVAPDRPVYIKSLDFHSGWVNSLALERAGITASTPDPSGGIIERDEEGRPNGLLHETAQGLVTRLLPSPTVKDLKASILWAQDFLFSLGVTSWQDAWVEAPLFQAYMELDRENRLSASVAAALAWDFDQDIEQIEDLVQMRGLPKSEYFSARIAKIIYDGVCEVATAALHEPYAPSHLASRFSRGLTFSDPTKLTEIVSALVERDFPIHFHCVGDRSATDCLDAIEAAQASPGKLRHQIAHVQLIRQSDIGRMAKLGIMANVQPASLCTDEPGSQLLQAVLGRERFISQYPLLMLREAGVTLAASSDWLVTTADPLAQIRAMCGYDCGSWKRMNPRNRLSISEAVDAYTWAGALASGFDDSCGQLKEGYFADMAILDGDILHDQSIFSHVNLTISKGKVAYICKDFGL